MLNLLEISEGSEPTAAAILSGSPENAAGEQSESIHNTTTPSNASAHLQHSHNSSQHHKQCPSISDSEQQCRHSSAAACQPRADPESESGNGGVQRTESYTSVLSQPFPTGTGLPGSPYLLWFHTACFGLSSFLSFLLSVCLICLVLPLRVPFCFLLSLSLCRRGGTNTQRQNFSISLRCTLAFFTFQNKNGSGWWWGDCYSSNRSRPLVV